MARFEPIQEVIKLALLGNDDILQREKGKMLTYAKWVWKEMNLSSTKVATRKLFKIDKRTNSIQMPCNFLQLSSVNVIGPDGNIWPVFRNDNVKGSDIVDVSAMCREESGCCDKKCSHRLCNTIKGYVAVTRTESDYLPNGDPISFTCVDRKSVDSNGFFYSERQYPLRVYESGVWTDTVLHTESKTMCRLEVDVNGCVTDCESNVEAVCTACGYYDRPPYPVGGDSMSFHNDPKVKTWIYYCNSKLDWFAFNCCGCGPGYQDFYKNFNNVYNISETGDRLIFPASFGHDHALVRYYEDINLSNMMVPYIAVPTFIAGLKWYSCRWNDNKQKLAQKYEIDFSKQQWGLLLELNKYRIAELKNIVTPHVYMPTFNQSYGPYTNAPD